MFVWMFVWMFITPVERGWCERPEDREWSSFRQYATGGQGRVEIEPEWTARTRERGVRILCPAAELLSSRGDPYVVSTCPCAFSAVSSISPVCFVEDVPGLYPAPLKPTPGLSGPRVHCLTGYSGKLSAASSPCRSGSSGSARCRSSPVRSSRGQRRCGSMERAPPSPAGLVP